MAPVVLDDLKGRNDAQKSAKRKQARAAGRPAPFLPFRVPTAEEVYVEPAEIARDLGISESTVYARLAAKHLPGERVGERRWRVLRAVYEAWKRGQSPAAEPAGAGAACPERGEGTRQTVEVHPGEGGAVDVIVTTVTTLRLLPAGRG